MLDILPTSLIVKWSASQKTLSHLEKARSGMCGLGLKCLALHVGLELRRAYTLNAFFLEKLNILLN